MAQEKVEVALAESRQVRTIPDFNTDLALAKMKDGLHYVVLSICAIVICFPILTNGEIIIILRASYNLVVLLLYLVSLPLLCVFVGIGSIIGGVSIFIGKHNWKNDAARLQAAIVDRRITQDFEDDEYYSYQVLKHELELKYTPVRAITDPGERTIWAHVGQSTWAKYEHLDAATIYYSVADPSVFFIEGE